MDVRYISFILKIYTFVFCIALILPNAQAKRDPISKYISDLDSNDLHEPSTETTSAENKKVTRDATDKDSTTSTHDSVQHPTPLISILQTITYVQECSGYAYDFFAPDAVYVLYDQNGQSKTRKGIEESCRAFMGIMIPALNLDLNSLEEGPVSSYDSTSVIEETQEVVRIIKTKQGGVVTANHILFCSYTYVAVRSSFLISRLDHFRYDTRSFVEP